MLKGAVLEIMLLQITQLVPPQHIVGYLLVPPGLILIINGGSVPLHQQVDFLYLPKVAELAVLLQTKLAGCIVLFLLQEVLLELVTEQQ